MVVNGYLFMPPMWWKGWHSSRIKVLLFFLFIALHTYASNAVLPAGFLHTYVVCEWKSANLD
jgi:hypothetical protein